MCGVSADVQEGSFLFRQVSVAIQRFNSVLFYTHKIRQFRVFFLKSADQRWSGNLNWRYPHDTRVCTIFSVKDSLFSSGPLITTTTCQYANTNCTNVLLLSAVFLILILIISKIVLIVSLLWFYVCLFVYIIMFFSTLVLIVSNFIVACAFVTC